MTNRHLNFIFILISSAFIANGLLNSCGTPSTTSEEKGFSEMSNEGEVVLEGAALAKQYCQGCHLYTPPDLLPRPIWESDVLPLMGAFYGIYEKKSREELLESGAARAALLQANTFPEKPIIDSVDWRRIKAYFLAEAPEELPKREIPRMKVKNVFKVESPKERLAPPMATMVQFGESKLIYHGDVKRDYSTINIFDQNLTMIQSLGMRSPAVKIREKDGGLFALLMGSFTSTDGPSGGIIKVSKANGSSQYNTLTPLLDSLHRPVDMEFADLDGDGDEDIIVAQFGNWAGKLEWFENAEGSDYIRHSLLSKTGAIRVIVEDINNDGSIDVLAMIAQADESIYAFLNDGSGRFRTKRLLQVPPTYGSLNFAYVDMNNDGVKDIVHVTGDNADYRAVLKPYHGIRIFNGTAELTFEEQYFYPVNGAYKALPEDYDGDGDLDIAVISFFPDYTTGAQESLIMLENQSKESYQFQGFMLPGHDLGRFDVMDSGDVDNDGDPDLILGSFVVSDPYGNQGGSTSESTMMRGPMLMMLRNEWSSTQ